MTVDSYAAPTTHSAPPETQGGNRLVVQLILVACAVSLVGMLVTLLLNISGEAAPFRWQTLRATFLWWCENSLLMAVFILVFMNHYQTRTGITAYPSSQRLLVLFAVFAAVAQKTLTRSLMVIAPDFWQNLYSDDNVSTFLLREAVTWLLTGLDTLLPLWLALHLSRHQADGGHVVLLGRGRLALTWGCAFFLLQLTLSKSVTQSLPMMSDEMKMLVPLFGALVLAAIVLWGAWARLPQRANTPSLARLLLLSVLLMGAWQLCSVAIGFLAAVALQAADSQLAILLTAVICLISLPLLWWLSRVIASYLCPSASTTLSLSKTQETP
ncbi:hypothetical protein [Pseudomonas sp. LRF_L74]|uniref:hypothetical protein n=1 Tax=Pseudomonas sp. LRF_L74 TaxID=3369422 RepID=UPI003F60F822